MATTTASGNRNASRHLERLKILRDRLDEHGELYEHKEVLRAVYTTGIILAELMIQQEEDRFRK